MCQTPVAHVHVHVCGVIKCMLKLVTQGNAHPALH